METNCTLLPYEQTGYFTKIVIDYLNGSESLQPFYKHLPNIQGIRDTIKERGKFWQNREALVEALKKQYEGVSVSAKLQRNIELLLENTTFTVTTAHQPNIFTGPLYFIYKILHTIKLAEELCKDFPEYKFVPVYYMGSEDADLDELGTIKIDGVAYTWQTKQTGAVGRMKVDKTFISLIGALQGQLGVLPYGNELTALFQNIYTNGKTIQQATLELVNHLFGEYGLVILIPDNPNLKKLFQPVVVKELTEAFSHRAVQETARALENHYKVQATGRELNLFYLTEAGRERIEFENGKFKIQNTGIELPLDEILDEVTQHPERFSPNVILRGVFQEMILPNIAFIGGGGELAYWLELKKVFEAVEVPFPLLVLRNSLLIVEQKWKEKMDALDLKAEDVFLSEYELINQVVLKRSNNEILLNGELDKIEDLYEKIIRQASSVDASLHDHVVSLRVRAVKHLQELQKKMVRAEKRKFYAEQKQILKLKSALFPNNSLQEREENIGYFYGKYGRNFLEVLLSHSLSLEQKFAILSIDGQ